MKTPLSATPKSGLFFAAVVLALQATPAVPAGNVGSGTYVGTIGTQRASVTFKDVYAFRAEDSEKKQLTVVILSESPMDKKAMTAALKKEREAFALKRGPYLDNMAYAQFEIDQSGGIKGLYFFKPPGSNLNLSGIGKSDVKVNTAKRVEGRFSSDEKSTSGEARKIDLRFATDRAEIGAPVKN